MCPCFFAGESVVSSHSHLCLLICHISSLWIPANAPWQQESFEWFWKSWCFALPTGPYNSALLLRNELALIDVVSWYFSFCFEGHLHSFIDHNGKMKWVQENNFSDGKSWLSVHDWKSFWKVLFIIALQFEREKGSTVSKQKSSTHIFWLVASLCWFKLQNYESHCPILAVALVGVSTPFCLWTFLFSPHYITPQPSLLPVSIPTWVFLEKFC